MWLLLPVASFLVCFAVSYVVSSMMYRRRR